MKGTELRADHRKYKRKQYKVRWTLGESLSMRLSAIAIRKCNALRSAFRVVPSPTDGLWTWTVDMDSLGTLQTVNAMNGTERNGKTKGIQRVVGKKSKMDSDRMETDGI